MNLNKIYEKGLFFVQNHFEKVLVSIFQLIVILIFAKILKEMLFFLTEKAFTARAGSKNYEINLKRFKTLLPIILGLERYTVYLVAFIVCLKAVGVDTSALIASLGIFGFAFGFGAQNIVKDFISGFFLIFDGMVKIGDVITIGSVTGEVEKIDLRNIAVREFAGRLWYFSNGDVRNFGNFNRDWGRAVVEVGVAYEQDVDKALKALKDVADRWVENNRDIVLEDPEVQGINTFGESSVVVRIVVKLLPHKHWGAERDLKLMIKKVFDEQKVEIPFNRLVVYNSESKYHTED